MARLDGDKLAPVSTIPDPQKQSHVFAAQSNHIEGGALLRVAFHLPVLDVSGFATVLNTWARYNSLTERSELDVATIPRSIQDTDFNRLPLSGQGWSGDSSEFQEYVLVEP